MTQHDERPEAETPVRRVEAQTDKDDPPLDFFRNDEVDGWGPIRRRNAEDAEPRTRA